MEASSPWINLPSDEDTRRFLFLVLITLDQVIAQNAFKENETEKVKITFDYKWLIETYLAYNDGGEVWHFNKEQSILLRKSIHAAYFYKENTGTPDDEFFNVFYHHHFGES